MARRSLGTVVIALCEPLGPFCGHTKVFRIARLARASLAQARRVGNSVKHKLSRLGRIPFAQNFVLQSNINSLAHQEFCLHRIPG